MKITSCGSKCATRGPRPPQLKFNTFVQRAFPLADLCFKSILSRKNWRGGGDMFLLKSGTIDGYAY